MRLTRTSTLLLQRSFNLFFLISPQHVKVPSLNSLSLCLMSHRFVARANLDTGYGVRPDAHARNSFGSWALGSARPRSRGRGFCACSGGRPGAQARSSSGGSWGYGSALYRALSFGDQALASDIGCVMFPKRRRLDDGASPGAGGSHDHFVSQGGGRLVPGTGLRGVGASRWFPSPGADGSRNLSDSFRPLDNAAGRSRLSLRISKAISLLLRYPRRRPADPCFWQRGTSALPAPQ